MAVAAVVIATEVSVLWTLDVNVEVEQKEFKLKVFLCLSILLTLMSHM